MELVWLLAMLVVSVATTSLIELLITTLRPHLLAPKFVTGRAVLKTHIGVAQPK